MMPASSNITSPTESSELVLPDGRTVPIAVRRSARARSVRLSLDIRAGGLRLTVPARGRLAPALAWAAGQEAWIAGVLARLVPGAPLAAGTVLLLEGQPHRIEWHADAPRTVTRREGCLTVGGPAELVPARLLRWLRAEALARLSAATHRLAAAHGLAIGRVRVGDARTRWGSCTSTGDIAYSWRLILAPPFVLEGVVAHELAHRLHMDHSPAFRATEARLLGRDPAPGRAWLRQHGPALHAVGRA
jgi:hypothetical protein